MKRPNFVTRLFTLPLVAVLAATAMPTAASGEPEQPEQSGTVTVTVEVADDDGGSGGEDPVCQDNAFLELRTNLDGSPVDSSPNTAIQAGLSGFFPARNPSLLELLHWTFRYEEDSRAAIAQSLGHHMLDDPQQLGFWESLEYISSIDYSSPNEPNAVLGWHPADLNRDGALSVPEDLPEFLKTAVSNFETPEFEVYFATGCLLTANETFGALFVSRSPVLILRQDVQDGESIESWNEAEVVNFYEVLPFDGLGTATLFKQGSVNSPNIFGSKFAQRPRSGANSPDLAAVGRWGTERYRALMEIRGQISAGSYKTEYLFDLHVGGPSELGALDNRLCNWFNESEPLCVLPDN